MDKGFVQVIYGGGHGKTSMALGKGIGAVTKNKKVIMIQFLKGVLNPEMAEWLKRLEPEFKVFRFEKQDGYFEALSDQQKQEERLNILNGLNFARKVLTTGECAMLILDEVLGILDQGIITEQEFTNVLDVRNDSEDVVLTGKTFPGTLAGYADIITKIENVEVDKR